MDVLLVLVNFCIFLTLPGSILARKHKEYRHILPTLPFYSAQHIYEDLAYNKDINTFPYYKGDNLKFSSGVDIGRGDWTTINLQKSPINSEANVITEKGNLKNTKIGTNSLIGSTSGTSLDLLNTPVSTIIDFGPITERSKRVKRNNELFRIPKRRAENYLTHLMYNTEPAYSYDSWPSYVSYPYMKAYPNNYKMAVNNDGTISITTKIDLGSGDFSSLNLRNSPITSDVNLKGTADSLRGTNINSDIGLGRGNSSKLDLIDTPISSSVNVDTTQQQNDNNWKGKKDKKGKKSKKGKKKNKWGEYVEPQSYSEYRPFMMYNAELNYPMYNIDPLYNSWPSFNSYPYYNSDDDIVVSTNVDVGGGDWGSFNIHNSPATAQVHLEGDIDDFKGTNAASTISIAKGSGSSFDMTDSPVSSKVSIGGKKKKRKNEIFKAKRRAEMKHVYSSDPFDPIYYTTQADNLWPSKSIFGGIEMVPRQESFTNYNNPSDDFMFKIFKKIDKHCPCKKTTREVAKCAKKVLKHIHGACKALLNY